MSTRRYWGILLRGDWKSPEIPGLSAWLGLVLVILIGIWVGALIAGL